MATLAFVLYLFLLADALRTIVLLTGVIAILLHRHQAMQTELTSLWSTLNGRIETQDAQAPRQAAQ
jgi:hypothetical protein